MASGEKEEAKREKNEVDQEVPQKAKEGKEIEEEETADRGCPRKRDLRCASVF